MCLKEGNLETALNVLEKTVREYPENFEIHSKLVSLSVKIGDPAKMARYLKEALRIRPDDPELWLEVMRLAVMNNDSKTAETAMDRAMDLCPDRKDIFAALRNISANGISGIDLIMNRIKENIYYENLFLKDPSWSSPAPNRDEEARWGKIEFYLKTITNSPSDNGGPKLRILDLGCGRGWLTNLASRYGYIEGIDPVREVIKGARRLFPHLRLHHGTARTILDSSEFNPYDLILSSEVIEHVQISEKEHFVNDLFSLLKPEGHVILTTPRGEAYNCWKKRTNFVDQPVEEWLTETELGRLFESRGFRVIGSDRIYVDLRTLEYMTLPGSHLRDAHDLLGLYQVWAFQRMKPSPMHSHIMQWDGEGSDREPSAAIQGGAKKASGCPECPLVSVIVPTHNRPEMLTAAIRSILSQTLRDFEIIVVNDAGEDVEEVVSSLGGGGKISYVRHDRNRGLAAARNAGLRLARGKYIAYLDDDDLYYPDHLETLVTHLERDGGKVAYTDAHRATQKMMDGGYVTINRDIPYSWNFNRDMFLFTNYVPVLCIMHEKACLEESGYFDETLTTQEDWDLWIRMSRKYDFVHIKKVTCEFSWRTDGTTMSSGKRSDYLRTMEIIYDKYRQISQGNSFVIDGQKRSLDALKAAVCLTGNNTSGVAVGEKVLVDATAYHVEPISAGRQPPTLDTRISVIIPVRNGGENIRVLLGKIRSQKKVREVEIIVIDSGSTDGTVAIAEEFGCRVIRIPEREFNHGATRNLGAREARGEFLVFTVQDALPATDYWLYAMVSPFGAYPELAALSSKQFVRPEADLFSLWTNEAIYKSLGFVEDSIYALSPSFDFANWKHFDSQIKRQLSFFDNVCSCVRRSVFDEIRFTPKINAEDIDFGVRLLEKRKKIGFLTTTGVYRWHERGSDYVLKRHFIGTKSNLYIMKNELTYFFNEHRIDWQSLAANILSLHDLVTVAVPEADSSGPKLLDVATAFVASMSQYMNASPDELSNALSAKTQTDGEGFKPRLLDLFGDAVPVPGEHADYKKNFLVSEFMDNIGHLVDFLSTRQFSAAEREKDFISCIYKTLAVTVGEALGSYYLEAETLDHLTDDLKRMDQVLANGVCYF